MLEVAEDLWLLAEHYGDLPRAVCITTNGDVNSKGHAVMGRGCAKQAAERYPGLAAHLGALIDKYGNRPMVLSQTDSYGLISFPVKHHWNELADLVLIGDSARELVRMVEKFGWQSVLLPRPGCGNGGLDWEDVKSELFDVLDDRFTIVSYKPEETNLTPATEAPETTDTITPDEADHAAPAKEAGARPAHAPEPLKFDVKHGDLIEALSIVGRAVPTKSTLPVLTNVLVEVDTGLVTITGNNLDVGIKAVVNATVWTPGRTTIPYRLLSDYVGELSKDDSIGFDLNVKTGKVQLLSGRYKANIATIDADDFPELPDPANFKAQPYTLPVAALRRLIFLTAYTAAGDDTRPVLAGVLIRIEDGKLTMAAADGFRLAAVKAPAFIGGNPLDVIVPANTMRAVERLLPPDDSESVVEMSLSDTAANLMFSTDTVDLTSRVIVGQFPDYQRIVPSEGKTTATLKTSELLRAVRAATIMARDNSQIVRLTVGPEVVEVKAISAEMGDSTAEVDAYVTGDPSATIAFNGRYLSDMLEHTGSERIMATFNGPSHPGLFRPIGADDQQDMDTTNVIMPMNISR